MADRESACKAILAGERRFIDLGRTDAGYFLGVAGAGFDSKVARRAQRQLPLLSGTAVYVYALLRTLTDFEPIPARVTYDSGAFEGLMTFVVAGNNDRYGGGGRGPSRWVRLARCSRVRQKKPMKRLAMATAPMTFSTKVMTATMTDSAMSKSNNQASITT